MTGLRFYCEHCGATVNARDKICKSCGSFFSQVRCPSCSYQGESREFLEGCPVCGYASEDTGKASAQGGIEFIDLPSEPARRLQARGSHADHPGVQLGTGFVIASILAGLSLMGVGLYYLIFVRGLL